MSYTITFPLGELKKHKIEDDDTAKWNDFLREFTSISNIKANKENFIITFDLDVISEATDREKIVVARYDKLSRVDKYQEWLVAIDELREDNPDDAYPNLDAGEIYYSFSDILQHASSDDDNLGDTLQELSHEDLVEMIGENGAEWFSSHEAGSSGSSGSPDGSDDYKGSEDSEDSEGSKSPEIDIKNVIPGGKLDSTDAKYFTNDKTVRSQRKDDKQDLFKPAQLPSRERKRDSPVKPVDKVLPRATEAGPTRAEIDSLSNILKGLSVDKPREKTEERPARTLEELTKLTGFSVIPATNKRSAVIGGNDDINKFILGLSDVSRGVEKKQKSPVVTAISPGQSAAAGGAVTNTRAKAGKEISPTGIEILNKLSVQKLNNSITTRGASENSYSNDELGKILKDIGLPVSGSKVDKIQRILAAIESVKPGGK